MSLPRLPRWTMALLPIGMLILGSGLQEHVTAYYDRPSLVASPPETSWSTKVKTIQRVVKGKIIRRPGGQLVIRVPQITVRTDHHLVRIPAHFEKISSLQAAVALPDEPITVYVTLPAETMQLPPSTSISTETVQLPPTTITITLPPIISGGPES